MLQGFLGFLGTARLLEQLCQTRIAAGERLEDLRARRAALLERLQSKNGLPVILLAFGKLAQPPLNIAHPVKSPGRAQPETRLGVFLAGEFPVMCQRLFQEVALQWLQARLPGKPVLGDVRVHVVDDPPGLVAPQLDLGLLLEDLRLVGQQQHDAHRQPDDDDEQQRHHRHDDGHVLAGQAVQPLEHPGPPRRIGWSSRNRCRSSASSPAVA